LAISNPNLEASTVKEKAASFELRAQTTRRLRETNKEASQKLKRQSNWTDWKLHGSIVWETELPKVFRAIHSSLSSWHCNTTCLL